ncbi:hypothetical protein L1049_027051 [Liquidambar formosana]|uniref:RNA helicase n=1 Tax=Liquidambar formosana TaxID=63359 RepID=A0AAP0NGM0_LIQFO
MKGTARRTLVNFSLSSGLFSSSPFLSSSKRYPLAKLPTPSRVFLGFKPLCTTATSTTTTTTTTSTTVEKDQAVHSMKHNILLEKLRMRQLKGTAKTPKTKTPPLDNTAEKNLQNESEQTEVVSGFEELGLSDEVIQAVMEMDVFVPTEIQCIGIPAVLDGKNVVLGSDTGSGTTLAYMLPIVQLLRRDEALAGTQMNPKCPRAVVLCPTKELSEQVFHVAESIGHHVQFRSAMVSDGGCSRPQADLSNIPIDMVVGTPGIVLQQIEEGNMVYDDIKYLVLDEADTMFDSGLGPEICKFLGPLKDRGLKSDDQGLQIVLVISKMTKMLCEQQFSLVERLERDNAGKVAGILLEMDQREVFQLIESPDALKVKVAEAMMSLV